MKTLKELIAYVQNEMNADREVAYTSLRGTRGFLYKVDAESFFLNYYASLQVVDKTNIEHSYAFKSLLGDDVDKYDYYRVVHKFDRFQTMTIAVRTKEKENKDNIEQELMQLEFCDLFEFSTYFREFDNNKYSVPHPMGDLDDAFIDYYPADIIKMAVNGYHNFVEDDAPDVDADYFIIVNEPWKHIVTLDESTAKGYLVGKMISFRDSDEVRDMLEEFKKENC